MLKTRTRLGQNHPKYLKMSNVNKGIATHKEPNKYSPHPDILKLKGLNVRGTFPKKN